MNFNAIKLNFIINFTHNNSKSLKLIILQFLDRMYLDRKEKKRTHRNILNNYFLQNSVFDLFENKLMRKQLLKYKFNKKCKFNFEIKLKGSRNVLFQNQLNRIYLSSYIYSKV